MDERPGVDGDAARAESAGGGDGGGRALVEEIRGPRPETADELHAWVRDALGVEIAREALIEGHAAPFDYLCHAYFEARSPRDLVVWANRGGGKTFLAAIATLADMVFKDGIEIRVLGGSLEQAKRMHAHLRAFLSRPGLDRLVEGRITQRRVRLVNGSSLELLAQSQTSVRGTRVQKLRCDEVELFDPDVWEAAQLVTRSKDCGGISVRGSVECLSTMHVPYGLMHRLVRECEGENATRRLFRWGLVDVLGRCGEERVCDSPCALLEECAGRAKSRDARGVTPGHVEVEDAITQKRRVGEGTWRSEMLCLEPRRSDCVLPEFDPRVHVVDALPESREGWLWVGGMDFGIRSPTVVLWAGLDPSGVLWVVDERVEAGQTLGTHVEAIKTAPWAALAWIGVDPAGGQRSGQTGLSDIQAMRQAGLVVKHRRMGVAEGLELVRARLRPASGGPRLLVHRRCAKLIESLETYRYHADRPESIEPVKDGSDHAVDALRYMVQNLDAAYETRYSRYA
ncbi:MAG: hypothetical protein R3B57_06640 [Phycisphaerales bacterium]